MALLELVRDDGERIKVDSFKRIVYFNNHEASFTENEWILLKGLYFKVGKPVSRKFLLELLPNQEHREDTRIVDVHMSSIRNKLQKLKVARVKSVYGVGYALCPSKKK